MNDPNSNFLTNSPAFPFEINNAIFVREAGSCSPGFVKVHVADILFLERKHDSSVTSIHLVGRGTIGTDASIDEIISACPSPVLLKTWCDEAVNLMHIEKIEGNSFIVGGCRHYLREYSGTDLRSRLTLCKAERHYPNGRDCNEQCDIPGKSIFLFSGASYEKVRLDKIIWISAAGNYCDIHLVGRPNPLCVIFLLGRLAAYLPRHIFVRISRSIIVNLNFVERIQGPVLFIPGCRLKVPCQKVRDIPSWFSIPRQS